MVKNNQKLNKNYNMINEYYDIAKKYFRGTISSEDEKRLSEWLKDAKNEHLFREWEDEWRTHAKAEASERTKAAWAKLQASGKLKVESQEPKAEGSIQLVQPVGRKLTGRGWLRYAASVAVMAVIGALTLWLLQPTPQEPFMAQTGAHEQQTITLPDGTQVTLNSLTTLACAVDFGKNDRQLTFDGEAVFHVAKDADKPFIIHVGDYSVTVLGTTFNLSAYTTDNAYTLTLIEGSVRIACQEESVILQPHEQARFDKADGTLSVEQVRAESAEAWLSGRLEFEHIALEDLVHKLERNYDVRIRFADEAAKHEQVYISVSTDDRFEDVCSALEALLPVVISRQDDVYVIAHQ